MYIKSHSSVARVESGMRMEENMAGRSGSSRLANQTPHYISMMLKTTISGMDRLQSLEWTDAESERIETNNIEDRDQNSAAATTRDWPAHINLALYNPPPGNAISQSMETKGQRLSRQMALYPGLLS